jgi:hypothetical protein
MTAGVAIDRLVHYTVIRESNVSCSRAKQVAQQSPGASVPCKEVRVRAIHRGREGL